MDKIMLQLCYNISFFALIDTEISPKVGENIMSLAEQLRQEGRQEGEANLVMKMLANGIEPTFIAKNTGFPLHQIKELQKKGIKMNLLLI
jgi:recombination-promoting nuclease RpnB